MAASENNKRKLYAGLAELCDAGPSGFRTLLPGLFDAEVQLRAAHPINESVGLDAMADRLWAPMFEAMPDVERRDEIVIGGEYEGRAYVGMMGHYCGTFERDLFTVPATGQPIFLRYGEIYEIRGSKVVQANCLWDVMDLIRQAGYWPVAPSLGREGRWPGPLTCDGIRLDASDPQVSKTSIAQTLAMHATLGNYDDLSGAGRQGLLDMPQKLHWHPKMMWYGPSGIGMTRRLDGFVDGHQLPFRDAFPMRKGGGQWDEIADVKNEVGGGHYIRIGDGPYSLTSGWPSVFAMHQGGSFLGLGATNRPVMMRVMDFYLHHEELIRENWVPIDMLDILRQMGVDVLARMQRHFRRRR